MPYDAYDLTGYSPTHLPFKRNVRFGGFWCFGLARKPARPQAKNFEGMDGCGEFCAPFLFSATTLSQSHTIIDVFFCDPFLFFFGGCVLLQRN